MPTQRHWEQNGRALHRTKAGLLTAFANVAANGAEGDAGLGRSPTATVGS